MKINAIFFSIFLLVFGFEAIAQDDLMSMLNHDDDETIVFSSFKSTRLISGHTTEIRSGGELDFVISHRFGRVNTGIDQFFGLDDAQIRLGLDYGISDMLNIGIGRSSNRKVVDSFLKYKILSQSQNLPVSLVIFGSVAIKTGDRAFIDPNAKNSFSDRLYYTFQTFVSRKVTSNLSLQISPSFVHRNQVLAGDPNNVLALGMGGRYKISSRVSLNAEWYPQASSHSNNSTNALSAGISVETGGHVFQMHLTNSRAMIEQGFITETDGSWADGDIHIGFNISRVFDFKPNK